MSVFVLDATDQGQGEIVADAFTDETGAYEASGIPTGDYVVAFDSWTDEYLGEYWDDAESVEAATPVGVVAGDVRADVDAELARSVTISGWRGHGLRSPLCGEGRAG